MIVEQSQQNSPNVLNMAALHNGDTAIIIDSPSKHDIGLIVYKQGHYIVTLGTKDNSGFNEHYSWDAISPRLNKITVQKINAKLVI